MRLNSKLWAAICKSITNILRLVTAKSCDYHFSSQARIDKSLITHTSKDTSSWKTACNKATCGRVWLHEGQPMRRKIHRHPSTYLCLVSPWQTLQLARLTQLHLFFCNFAEYKGFTVRLLALCFVWFNIHCMRKMSRNCLYFYFVF